MVFSEGKIGRYRILKRLAVGGMAELFLAKEEGIAGFERLVVIKRVFPHLSEQKEFIDMFLDEARLAALLTHPNIVHIYELGEEEGNYYIVMEYIKGVDLYNLIKRMKGKLLSLGDAIFIVTEILNGLHYAHELKGVDGKPLNIVHRDINPKNILISDSGVPKIVDFGIAKARTRVSYTRPGDIKGTFAYMAPEQARGELIDRRVDIYAVGSLLYWLVTGERAYPQSGEELLKAVKSGDFIPPRKLNPELPLEVERVIMKAMAKELSRRYLTASDMRRELIEVARYLGVESDSEQLGKVVKAYFPELLSSSYLVEDQVGTIEDGFAKPEEYTDMVFAKERDNHPLISDLIETDKELLPSDLISSTIEERGEISDDKTDLIFSEMEISTGKTAVEMGKGEVSPLIYGDKTQLLDPDKTELIEEGSEINRMFKFSSPKAPPPKRVNIVSYEPGDIEHEFMEVSVGVKKEKGKIIKFNKLVIIVLTLSLVIGILGSWILISSIIKMKRASRDDNLKLTKLNGIDSIFNKKTTSLGQDERDIGDAQLQDTVKKIVVVEDGGIDSILEPPFTLGTDIINLQDKNLDKNLDKDGGVEKSTTVVREDKIYKILKDEEVLFNIPNEQKKKVVKWNQTQSDVKLKLRDNKDKKGKLGEPATLRIIAVPSAKVYIDGQFIGNTPKKEEILPGPHTIKLEVPGKEPKIIKLRVKSGEDIRLKEYF